MGSGLLTWGNVMQVKGLMNEPVNEPVNEPINELVLEV